MKKMWMVAAIVCAALMVSCGGEKKVDPVVAKAQEMAAKMKNVTSEAEAIAVTAPYLKYYDSLSEADQEKFDKAVEAALKAAEAPEAEVAEPVAATSGATTVAEPVEAEVSPAVKAKATEYANQMVAAIKAGDMEKAEKIDAEANAWFEKLSEVEQMQAGEIVAKIASEAGLE